jgi:hypothetical protein
VVKELESGSKVQELGGGLEAREVYRRAGWKMPEGTPAILFPKKFSMPLPGAVGPPSNPNDPNNPLPNNQNDPAKQFDDDEAKSLLLSASRLLSPPA